MKPHLDALVLDELKNQATLPHSAQKAIFYELEQPRIGDFDISCQIPRQVNHGNDRFEGLQFVPLVTLDRQLILSSGQRPDVPGDIVAPTDSLDPMDAA